MQVKICGLKEPFTMAAALEAGADFVGLVFFEKSPRHVSLERATALAHQARGQAKIVALTVNPDDETLDAIASAFAPDYLQLHGHENPERVAAIAGQFNIPIIKAIGVERAEDAALADDYEMAEIILFDAKADPKINELPGGRGIPFDWQVLKGQKEQRAFMLSGGLNPQNVRTAIAQTGTLMVDVSSGVERAPGDKDAAKIAAFIKAAKSQSN